MTEGDEMNGDKITATAEEIKKAINESDFTSIEKFLYNGDYKTQSKTLYFLIDIIEKYNHIKNILTEAKK